MVGKRKLGRLSGEQNIHIRNKLAGHAKDFLFWVDFRTRPGIALRGFYYACLRVDCGEEFSQFPESLSFLNIAQQLRMRLEVVVFWALRGSSPWHLQSFVILAEFDREISLH